MVNDGGFACNSFCSRRWRKKCLIEAFALPSTPPRRPTATREFLQVMMGKKFPEGMPNPIGFTYSAIRMQSVFGIITNKSGCGCKVSALHK